MDALRRGFVDPPNSAKPRVWWHWVNGNITKEGIRSDLEWMHRVGLAGFEIIDADIGTPQVVEKRLAYMAPDWKDAFRYATALGDQLGMEEAVASSPGWSETGGPWVPASQGMKKYVWSETLVEGGKPFTGKLVHPPSNTGAFQSMGILDHGRAVESAALMPQFYADSVVIACKRPANDVSIEFLNPKMTASAGTPDFSKMSDGDLAKTTRLPVPSTGKSAWIQYEFAEPQTVRSLTFVIKEMDVWNAVAAGISIPEKSLEASDDGIKFRVIVKLPNEGAPEHTVSFPPVTAKYFRVAFKRTLPMAVPKWISNVGLNELEPTPSGKNVNPPTTDFEIAELVLHPGARVNRFEDKAGAYTAGICPSDLYQLATTSYGPADTIAKSDVVNLTDKLHPDGTLDWTPPNGNWVVLRFGYSLLGITNRPATAKATGLEVDKLNGHYVKAYMDTYLESYENVVGADWMGKRGIKYMTADSWEAGTPNWTDDMIDEFKKRRGYDPVPWMPVLTGRVVDSSESSDRFLWDFRKTIADLIADEHYGQMAASLKDRGMGLYNESHELGRAYVADGMEVKKYADFPMGAMWVQRPGTYDENYDNEADDRESASVAHIYGQNIAACESMTAAIGAWYWSPATLKPTADAELLSGINRFVIHESTHQPLVDKAPGLTLGPFGQWFNRNETWAEQAAPWVTYISRSSFMLQQGRFFADLVYFYGEDSNLTAIFKERAPDIPDGYAFDYINADALIHELRVTDGRITTRSGMSYRVLGLDPYSQHMSLPVLSAIHKLVENGGVIAGPKPIADPSLADDQTKFHQLADELFGDGTGVHHVGQGTVYAGQNILDVFNALKLARDFDFSKPENDTRLQFVHRKLADGDLYFVDNRSGRDESVYASFRVTGRAPELWHAETGEALPVSYRIADGRTTVPLHLEPWGTVFVVFRKQTDNASLTLPPMVEAQLATFAGPWNVSFQPNRGAPESVTLSTLTSWSDSPDSGVKYFSGTGTYTKTIDAPTNWFGVDSFLWIDLGDVKNLAEVSVNGKALGIVWHAPYRVQATGVLMPGPNEITIKVTNSWANRLIGDEQSGVAARYTFTDVRPYRANAPLLPSGLLGPVRLLSAAKQ